MDVQYSVRGPGVYTQTMIAFLEEIERLCSGAGGRQWTRSAAWEKALSDLHGVDIETEFVTDEGQPEGELPQNYVSVTVELTGTLAEYVGDCGGFRLRGTVHFEYGVPYTKVQPHEYRMVERLVGWLCLYVDMPALYILPTDLRPMPSSA